MLYKPRSRSPRTPITNFKVYTVRDAPPEGLEPTTQETKKKEAAKAAKVGFVLAVLVCAQFGMLSSCMLVCLIAGMLDCWFAGFLEQ